MIPDPTTTYKLLLLRHEERMSHESIAIERLGLPKEREGMKFEPIYADDKDVFPIFGGFSQPRDVRNWKAPFGNRKPDFSRLETLF